MRATLKEHVPCKIRHARGSQMLFFEKELSKTIMTSTKLLNNFIQNKSKNIRKLF